MQLFVSPADDLPIYRQIVRQVVDAIASGRCVGGEQLPSHRELSEQLVIAPLTVKRAYDELESLGYIETQRGRGTYVCARIPRAARAVQVEHVREAVQQLLTKAYLAGMQLSDLVTLMNAVDREITQGHAPRHRKLRGTA